MKSTELVISVVVPMYNAATTIVRALDSVKRQTYRCGYQILVVDDGSDDNSREIVDKYMADNPQMDITVVSQPNGGVSAARNAALRQAEGDYIAFLDSDDEWLPEKIEKQIDVFQQNTDIDLLGTNRNGEHIKSLFGLKFKHLTRISSKMLLFKNFFPTPSVLIKNDSGKKVVFEENRHFMEDADCWIRFCKENNCYLLNESLVITGGGKPSFGFSGLSSNMWKMQQGEIKNIRVAYESGIINSLEYCFFNVYSLLKYLRRLIIKKFQD